MGCRLALPVSMTFNGRDAPLAHYYAYILHIEFRSVLTAL